MDWQGCGGNHILIHTGWGVNRYTYFGKWFGVANKAECLPVLYLPTQIPFLDIYTQQKCVHTFTKDISSNIFSTSIHNDPKLETIKMHLSE